MNERSEQFQKAATAWLEAKIAARDAAEKRDSFRRTADEAQTRVERLQLALGGFVGQNIPTRLAKLPLHNATVVVRHPTGPEMPRVEVFNVEGEMVRT